MADRLKEPEQPKQAGGPPMMTNREAINVFDHLREAVAALKPMDEVQARNALSGTHVIPFSMNMQVSSAMGALRAFFHQIDTWESRNPSN